MAFPVHLDRWPRNAFLVAWGRAYEGWWACITFRQAVRTDTGSDELAVAAWVPASAVTPPPWGGKHATNVPRLQLGERGAWPAPPGWPAWYAGVWLDGDLPLPPGAVIATGPAWRRKQ